MIGQILWECFDFYFVLDKFYREVRVKRCVLRGQRMTMAKIVMWGIEGEN